MQQEISTITAKLVEHDQKFDKIDKRFDEVDKRFDKVESSIDLLAVQMLKHEERLDRIEENMATKADINVITGTLDKILKMVERKDQELTVAQSWMSRTDDRLDVVEADVNKMKPALGMA